MAYDGTIPALGNLISNDIPAIQENFSLLEDAQIVDDNLDVASPSNGYYVRWENGLQICFNYITDTSIAVNTSSGSLYTSAVDTFSSSFPVSFISQPKLTASFNRQPGGFTTAYTVVYNSTVSNFSYNYVAGTSVSSIDMNFSYIAIGRWK